MLSNALSFVAVVKAGGFSKGARLLGVSKAQLSRHVSQLEASLGIQLLYRTTRSMTLTESGEQFFLSCRELEETYAEAVDNLKQDFQSIRGTLRITAPISFGSEFLPSILYQFNKIYPNIKIILSLSSVTEDLVEKNFDVSIRIAPTLPDSSLRMRKILSLDMVLVASPNYLAERAHPLCIEDLKAHQCITSINRTMGQSRSNWTFYQNKKITHFTPTSIIEVDSLRAQVQFITLGAGIARLPTIFIQQELDDGRLIRLLPALEQQKLLVYLLYPNRKNLPKKLQIFIDFIKEYL